MNIINNIDNYIKQKYFKMYVNDNYIDIENFEDIDKISDTEIIVLLKTKKLIITGKSLSICKLLNSEILIKGNYLDISFRGLNV